jgi:hypothetical protein
MALAACLECHDEVLIIYAAGETFMIKVGKGDDPWQRFVIPLTGEFNARL